MEHYANSLNKFFEYLNLSITQNKIMILGYNIFDPDDVKRNIKADIFLNIYKLNDIESLITSSQDLNSYFILNMDFNNFCVLNKGLIAKFNNINKINKIIFDSSTFKFMTNIKMIALFYYLALEQNGVIFIESNKPFFTNFVIDKYYQLTDIPKFNKDGFCYPYGFSLTRTIENSITSDKYLYIKEQIATSDEIYEKNTIFIKKWFYGSNVELLDNLDNSYPITNDKYPITKYYKITKILPHNIILDFISDSAKEYDMGLSMCTNTIVRFGI
jgi:hypothetical protein